MQAWLETNTIVNSSSSNSRIKLDLVKVVQCLNESRINRDLFEATDRPALAVGRTHSGSRIVVRLISEATMMVKVSSNFLHRVVIKKLAMKAEYTNRFVSSSSICDQILKKKSLDAFLL